MFIDDKLNRILFEKTVIGLALCRMNGDLVYVNDAFSKLLGRSNEETLGLTYWEVTPEKFKLEEKAQLDNLERTGKYGPYEKEYIHADGHLIPVRLSGQIVEIDGEKFIWSSVEDISDRKKVEDELARLYKEMEDLSLHDDLTGIANRRMFDQTLENEWKHAQRSGSPLSLIMLDIDFFKQYNDCYGHQEGDECLKKVAMALSGVSKRTTDLIGRYGGEEFVILLSETNKAQGQQIAEQCIRAVKDMRIPHQLSSVSDVVTISAGVSTIIPAQKSSSSILVKSADKLLYQAKQNGRDRYEHQE